MVSIYHPALFIYKRVRKNAWPPHTYRLLLRDRTARASGKTQSYTFRPDDYRFKEKNGRTYLQITKALFNRDRQFFRRFDTYQNRIDSLVLPRNGQLKSGRKQEVRP